MPVPSKPVPPPITEKPFPAKTIIEEEIIEEEEEEEIPLPKTKKNKSKKMTRKVSQNFFSPLIFFRMRKKRKSTMTFIPRKKK